VPGRDPAGRPLFPGHPPRSTSTVPSIASRDRCQPHDSRLAKPRQNRVGGLIRRDDGRVDAELGTFGRLVRRVDAGEVLQLAAAGLAAESFRIPRLGDRQRRVDEHLEELAKPKIGTRCSAWFILVRHHPSW
jgi:hypothetical protein